MKRFPRVVWFAEVALGIMLWGVTPGGRAAPADPAAYLTPPYLQNVKLDGITLMWELGTIVPAEVEYGVTTAYGATVPCTREASRAGTQIYKCVLTGLLPGTTHHFRPWLAGRAGADATFTTAPAGQADFSFAVWSDSQGSNHGAYEADPLEPTKSMMSHMAAQGMALAVAVGDMAENGAAYADTRQYYLDRVARLLGARVPWYVAWGNHDAGEDAVIRQFSDLPSRDRPGFSPGYGSYSFDYAGCHFICLDNATRYEDVLDWLETDLRSDANRQARFTFLFAHVPPYCELWIDGDEFFRETLVPLMEAYGVDVCFSGHTHEYSRGFLNGVAYCITGGGSWLDRPEVLVSDWPHMTVGGFSAIPGVFKPGPERGGGLINEYVRVDVRGDAFTASMIGFDPDGKPVGVLDRFSSAGGASLHPPATPQVSGPPEFDVFGGTPLILRSSPFADPDPEDRHQQSAWRLSRSPDPEVAGEIVQQGVSAAGVYAWSVPTANLWPGETLYASVRHLASDGQASPFAPPIAIRFKPEPLYREDFESGSEFSLPPGWRAQHRTTTDSASNDPGDPRSNLYLTWTVISASRLALVMGANRVNVPAVVRGQSVYAESDHRRGVQIQYLTTPDYDLSGATNVVVMFRSNYVQNQDSLAALEYSTDQGGRWQPVVYLLDNLDVVRGPGASGIDGAATFSQVDPSGVPTADGRNAAGGTYGEHILSRPFSALGPFVDSRLDDNPTESKRLERFRLPGADAQARVRFRFTLVGTSSWFWGIDDFSLYGTAHSPEPLTIGRVTQSAGGLDLEWTGPAGPYQVQFRPALETGAWVDLGEPLAADRRSAHLPIGSGSGFFRVRLAR